MYLIIDLGNTSAKLAMYENYRCVTDVEIVSHDDIITKSISICNKYDTKFVCIASVTSKGHNIADCLRQKGLVVEILTSLSKVPFVCKYDTITTLGIDRIAAVEGALSQYKDDKMLIIDAGTAITYEFIVDREYVGGCISPGLSMRFKALNQYTAKLPLCNVSNYDNWIGHSTNSAIAAGVVNGLCFEIKEYINTFFPDKNEKKVVLFTGGDHKYLAQKMKNSIFVVPNLVLDGIASLYEKIFIKSCRV